MSWTGNYACDVAGCDYETGVDGDNGRPDTVARASMLAHGRKEHFADWSGVGNETWARTWEAKPTSDPQTPLDPVA